jgi:hypothetical protein
LSDLIPLAKYREKPSGKAEVSDSLELALVTLVSTGCTQEIAAQTAGLTREHLCRSLSKPHVAARYQQLLRDRLSAMAPKALGTVENLLDCDSSYVRLQSAIAVMDRVGLRPVEAGNLQTTEVTINIDLS